MSQQSEQAVVERAVDDIGYLHKNFSVEVTTASRVEAGQPASKAKVIVVRNEVTKVWQTYRRGRGHAWLGEFRRDLTAGAFN